MSVNSNYTGHGGFGLSKETLDHQLYPNGPQVSIRSAIFNSDVPFAQRDKIDITRLGTLIVNGKTIYANASIPCGKADTATYVFNQMEQKLDSTTLALRAASLLQQGVNLDALTEVHTLKETATTHTLTPIRKISVLTTDKEKFNLSSELLLEKRNIDDIEAIDPNNAPTYCKVKTVVSGTIVSLSARMSDELTAIGAFTKECKTMREALKDDYSQTFNDKALSHSYLKP